MRLGVLRQIPFQRKHKPTQEKRYPYMSFSFPISKAPKDARSRKKSIHHVVNLRRSMLHHASILFKKCIDINVMTN